MKIEHEDAPKVELPFLGTTSNGNIFLVTGHSKDFPTNYSAVLLVNNSKGGYLNEGVYYRNFSPKKDITPYSGTITLRN